MSIINLTPHAITVVMSDDAQVVFEPSGKVARCAATKTPAGEVAGIPVFKTAFGAVEGLPEPQEGTTYIVSALVMSALAGTRPDVVSPLTDNTAIRENGQIVAVRGFQRS